ncbi:MAG: cytochrome C, partial [Acidobacteria bacterium]|nr:cytochrome C [Acidobacteriota bacterium]
MSTRDNQRRLPGVLLSAVALCLAIFCDHPATAHIVPPEELHPITESYRRLGFFLQLRPLPSSEVARDVERIAAELEALDAERASAFARAARPLVESLDPATELEPNERQTARRALFELATRALAGALETQLADARASLADYGAARRSLDLARQLWEAFEVEIRAADPQTFVELGRCWLELSSALGHPGVLGVGVVAPDSAAFAEDADELARYLRINFGEAYRVAEAGAFAPVPRQRSDPERAVELPIRLPPGANLNKQLPRPRQVLNMATRGVDERETTLIALGDMGFDSSFIFGEPARSLALSCNTCHNKSITNPGFFIPGLSSRPGGLDVSSSFFAPHANNGHFDPIDIPDLRGIRFTAPYGRNGRFDSLREFIRNVIVNEFNGPEPDPTLLDGLIAYMLEFDFLPNPLLRADGRLTDAASAAAKAGEEIFNREFEQMGGRSCASCHLPSDHFLDRRRHDIDTVAGAEENSRDGALDTPTLLSSLYTAPYFADGSQPTLRSVNEWFNDHYELGLGETELEKLTAYVETVGSGVDAYEDTLHTLEAELEEFSFFLSTYEFLKQRQHSELIAITFKTIALEIRAHKWDVQDPSQMPTLDHMASLMD